MLIDPLDPAAALARYAPQFTALQTNQGIEYLQAGRSDIPVTHVMLHGIGSSAASWLAQLDAVSKRSAPPAHRLLAWNAPGYGNSSPVSPSEPVAADYAERLWQWLDLIGAMHPITLVGQSMGCLIAAAAAIQRPERVSRLILFAPARGYARASAQERERRRDERLAALREHGPAGLAERRAQAMLSPNAPPELVSFVREIMRRVNPSGYTQATHMLSQGDLDSDLARWRKPLVVASGSADAITPPDSCREAARLAGVEWTDLGAVGHGCPLEAPGLANAILGLE
jgi:pimeloyl-ACP methyl ester carboxylesterase